MKFTEAPSKVSASTSRNKKSSYQYGIECEHLVLQYYESRGFKLEAHRWKTPFAEIDLVLSSPISRKFLWVEVKALSSPLRMHFRLSKRQRVRLKRAFLWAVGAKIPLEGFHLAFVSPNGQIQVLERFLS